MCRRGLLDVAPDRSGSTTPNSSSRPLAASRNEHGLDFPLLHGNAETVPYPDASFDLAISEYGASIWADPYSWVPEASRLLRPGGGLIFLVNATILMLCMPDAEEAATNAMLRPYRGLHRLEWTSDQSVNFHLGYGDWIRLLRANCLRGGGPRRALSRGRGRGERLPVRHERVGPPVAKRGGLEGAQGRLTFSYSSGPHQEAAPGRRKSPC